MNMKGKQRIKYSFIVEYTSFKRKEALVDKLKELNCIVESELDFAKCICVNMTMAQLAEMKKCDFVNSVEKNYDYSLLSMTRDPDKEIFLNFWLENLLSGRRKIVFIRNRYACCIAEKYSMLQRNQELLKKA